VVRRRGGLLKEGERRTQGTNLEGQIRLEIETSTNTEIRDVQLKGTHKKKEKGRLQKSWKSKTNKKNMSFQWALN